MADIKDKTAIVTGAGRGIGRAIALAYGRAGAKVVVSSRRASTVDAVVDEIKRAGGTAAGVPCDVGHRDQVYKLVARTVETFGTVDILVNNAQSFGTAAKPHGSLYLQPLETFDEEEWDNVYRTGLMSTLWGMKAAFPYLKAEGGKIINFGSTTGQVGLEGAAAYNATKEGIRALTRTAAREWGKYRINVNVINPALKTDSWDEFARENPDRVAAALKVIPLGRMGEPADVGPLAVFLGSSDSDYITGMTFLFNGGRHMFP